jgi:hypothetical protein
MPVAGCWFACATRAQSGYKAAGFVVVDVPLNKWRSREKPSDGKEVALEATGCATEMPRPILFGAGGALLALASRSGGQFILNRNPV